MTVVISDGRITAIGKTGALNLPSHAQVIDATGKYLIPGLWDMHTHVRNDYPGATKNDLLPVFFKMYVANGITGIRNMGGPGGYHLYWNIQKRKAVAEGTLLGPRIIVAGQPLDGPVITDGDKLPIHNDSEGRRAVRDTKASGADFVKIYDGVGREAYFSIADECKKLDIAFAGHVPLTVTAEEASNAGQRSIEHVSRVREGCYVYEADPSKTIPDPDPELTGKLKQFLLGIFKNSYDANLLSPDLARRLSSGIAKIYLKNLDAEQGELNSLEFRRAETQGKTRVYLYKAVYRNVTRYYEFSPAEDGKLNWFLAEPDIFDERKAASLFATFKKNHTWQCPTLTALRAIAYRDDPALFQDASLRYVPVSIRNLLDPKNDVRLAQFTPDIWAKQKRGYERNLFLVGRMRDAGVEFLAGTDAITDFCIPGFGLHTELELMVQAGLTPMEALQAATRNPAIYLGLMDSSGTIEKGKIADLVLLDANPIESISNTRRIEAVIIKGKLLGKEELQRMLAEVESAAGRK